MSTEYEIYKMLSGLDPMARETIRKALENANGSTNKHVRERLLRATSDNYIPPDRPTDAIFQLNMEKEVLIIRLRESAYLNIGRVKRDFLRRKRIKGKWKIDGKPERLPTGFKEYTFKRFRPKPKKGKTLTPEQEFHAAYAAMSPEERMQFIKNQMS